MPWYGWSEQLFLGDDPWRDGGRRGDAAPMGGRRVPKEQKAPQAPREERTNFSWVRGKGGSMGK